MTTAFAEAGAPLVFLSARMSNLPPGSGPVVDWAVPGVRVHPGDLPCLFCCEVGVFGCSSPFKAPYLPYHLQYLRLSGYRTLFSTPRDTMEGTVLPPPHFCFPFHSTVLHRFWFRACVAGSRQILFSSFLPSFIFRLETSVRLSTTACCSSGIGAVCTQFAERMQPLSPLSSPLHGCVFLWSAFIRSAALTLRYCPRQASPLLKCRGSARGLVNLLPWLSAGVARCPRLATPYMHGARGMPIRARTESFLLPTWKSGLFQSKRSCFSCYS